MCASPLISLPSSAYRGRILEKEMKKEARARISKPFISSGYVNRGIKPLPYDVSEPAGSR